MYPNETGYESVSFIPLGEDRFLLEGSCEDGNEISGSIKFRGFPNQVSSQECSCTNKLIF
jgi:hypothetical protein